MGLFASLAALGLTAAESIVIANNWGPSLLKDLKEAELLVKFLKQLFE